MLHLKMEKIQVTEMEIILGFVHILYKDVARVGQAEHMSWKPI